MRPLTEAEAVNLERLMDSCGVERVAQQLAELCALKANHLEDNWQDRSSAKVWRRAWAKFEGLAGWLHINGI